MKFFMKTYLMFSSLGLLVMPLARAAGFDCEKASQPIEVAICGDGALSEQDENLNDAYTYLIAQCPKATADSDLQATQRHWLAKIRKDFGKGGPESMSRLKEAYRSRNDDLVKFLAQCSPDHGPAHTTVTKVRDTVNNNDVLFVQTNPPQPGWRINRVLFKDYNGRPPPYLGGLGDFFANHGAADDRYTFYNLELILNKDNLLVVDYSGLYYEEGFPRAYEVEGTFLFDIRTGHEFKINDLFADRSASGFKQYIREKLFEMAKTQHIPIPEADTNSDTDRHTLCIDIWWKDSIGMIAQFLPDGRISIPYFTCATGRLPNYKTGPNGKNFYNMNLSVTPSEIRQYLTPYGKSLLLSEGEVLVPAQ